MGEWEGVGKEDGKGKNGGWKGRYRMSTKRGRVSAREADREMENTICCTARTLLWCTLSNC